MSYSCSSIRLPLEEFEAIDVSLNRSSTVRQGQPCLHGRLVPFQSMGKLSDFSHSCCLDSLQPDFQLAPLKLAGQREKLLNKMLRLSHIGAFLTNERQYLVGPALSFLGRLQEPADDLTRCDTIQQ